MPVQFLPPTKLQLKVLDHFVEEQGFGSGVHKLYRRLKVLFDGLIHPAMDDEGNVAYGCFGAGARGPGSLGLAPVVATASFSTYKSPKFYLSFTILVSFILVRYPDRIGLVNTVGTYLRYGTVGPGPPGTGELLKTAT